MAGAVLLNMTLAKVTGSGLIDGAEEVTLQAFGIEPAMGGVPTLNEQAGVRLGFGAGLRTVDTQDMLDTTLSTANDPRPDCLAPGQIFVPDDPGCPQPGRSGADIFDLDTDVDVTVPPVPDPSLTPLPTAEPLPSIPPSEGLQGPHADLPGPPATDLPPVPEPDVPDIPEAEVPDAVPGINFNTEPLPGEYPWDWMKRIGVPPDEIMHRLEEAGAELEQTTGQHVEWHGCPDNRWVEVGGRSDAPFVIGALRPFLANGVAG
jgi:hypothetical protein